MNENFEFVPGHHVSVLDIRTADKWTGTVEKVWAGGRVVEVRRDSNQILYRVGTGFVSHVPKDSTP